MLLAYRLVKLIEEHSDGLARSLHNRYQNCEKCSAYANVPESELIEKVFPEHVKAIVKEFSRLKPAEQKTMRRLCRKLGIGDNKEEK